MRLNILKIGFAAGVSFGSSQIPAASLDLGGASFKTGHPVAGEHLEEYVAEPREMDRLLRSAEALAEYPNVYFEIAGFVDKDECSGLECEDLALRRTALVYRFLLDRGIEPARLVSLSEYGSTRPISTRPEDVWLNQRVEINVALDPVR